MGEFQHFTVMKKEAIQGLKIDPHGIYVDCTLGGAGHSQYILEHLAGDGHLYAFDQDQQAIDFAEERLSSFVDKNQVTFIKSNFRYIKEELLKKDVTKVNGILYDLGVSSPQLDDAKRGFSYQQDAPLDMRMDQNQDLSAYEVINSYDYHQLVKIFYRYGEEKFSKQIARKIEQSRKDHPILTTGQLVDLIKTAIPAAARRKGGHPAKRVFQAVRIAVNDELGAIEDSLEQAIDLLTVNGRVSVITFHSLEDRIVKNIFKEYSQMKDLPAGLPVIPADFQPVLSIINRKPILPSKEELAMNRRSRSAKLRVAEKIKEE